jgi:hypothetical protein
MGRATRESHSMQAGTCGVDGLVALASREAKLVTLRRLGFA